MNPRWAAAGLLAVVTLLAGTAGAAPGQRWSGRERQIEQHLRTAAVTRIENVGTGVTRPRRAYLSPAEPVASCAWKVLPPGRRGGHWESYTSEIAAYLLDRLLGMEMVPPAVEREIDGETGAAVMWIEGTRTVKEIGGRVPSTAEWGAAIRRMLLFDDLIGNPDRNAGNIVLAEPGTIILIDHSRAFVTDTRLPNRLDRVDADLWRRIETLRRDDVIRVLSPWIDGRAIDALFARRRKMIETVEARIRRKGRAAVVIGETR
jgi:hypothetical protein